MASLCKSSANVRSAWSLRSASRPGVVIARPSVRVKSLGKDVVDGFLDVAKLVGGFQGNKSPYDELASAIGKDVYVDVAGWHLYLRDMTASGSVKMHTLLASQFGPNANKGLREADVEAVLRKIPVRLGAGRKTVSLYEVVPSMCVADLTKILEEFGRKR